MKTRKGFTLIELVVVMVIIGILAAIAVPRYFEMAENARYASFQATHRTIVTGVVAYTTANAGAPPSAMSDMRKYLAEVNASATGSEANVYNNKPKGATYSLSLGGVVSSTYVAQQDGKDSSNLIAGHTDGEQPYTKGQSITMRFIP